MKTIGHIIHIYQLCVCLCCTEPLTHTPFLSQLSSVFSSPEVGKIVLVGLIQDCSSVCLCCTEPLNHDWLTKVYKGMIQL